MTAELEQADAGRDFIRDIVQADLEANKHAGVVTRFPPEPNGYLHIGHAKSIALNFGIAQEFGGKCHLRFDDTNPAREEQEYIDAIQRDVRWLGFDWGENLFYASDYFDQLFAWAEDLIRAGLAYVDDQSQDDIRLSRGTLTEPGKNSPFRDRGVEENLDLFRRMKAGEFPNGARVLRARIDMASGNINLRDPVLYRIIHAEHPRTGKAWSIYPSYDYAHGQSDAIEGITHSICTLEFEDHRPLYDWLLDRLSRASEKPLGWWALGRIGARQPLYGSAHQVVPAEDACRWLEGVLATDWKKVEPAAFAATQLARLTGDRSRDLPDGSRDEVLARLAAINASSSWIDQITTVIELDKADERRAFGESLPAGLRLLHDDRSA